MPPCVQQPPFPEPSAVGILECLFQVLQLSCVTSFITVCLWQEDKGTAQSAAQRRYIPAARIRATWTPFLAWFVMGKEHALFLPNKSITKVTVML